MKVKNRKVKLTKEEFEKARENIWDSENCIGATALKKAYPEFNFVSFGVYDRFLYNENKRHVSSVTAFDYKGKESNYIF